MTLNAIDARLHSLAPNKISTLPTAIQKLLKEDVPLLIEIAVAAYHVASPETVPIEFNRRWEDLVQSLRKLEPPVV